MGKLHLFSIWSLWRHRCSNGTFKRHEWVLISPNLRGPRDVGVRVTFHQALYGHIGVWTSQNLLLLFSQKHSWRNWVILPCVTMTWKETRYIFIFQVQHPGTISTFEAKLTIDNNRDCEFCIDRPSSDLSFANVRSSIVPCHLFKAKRVVLLAYTSSL